MKYFSILRQMKSDVSFEYVSWKLSNFVSFPLFGFTLVIKLRNSDFESHWNALIFLDKKYMTSDLNMPHGKMADFVSFPLLGFTLVIKVRNFDFESHWNTLMFWQKIYDVRFEYVRGKMADFVSFPCLGSFYS